MNQTKDKTLLGDDAPDGKIEHVPLPIWNNTYGKNLLALISGVPPD